jgi:DNA-binding CsgD family transcriptional regulator
VQIAAAEALLDACVHQPEGLPEALDAAGRLLGFEYFCLASADLDRPAFIASQRQNEGIAPLLRRWAGSMWIIARAPSARCRSTPSFSIIGLCRPRERKRSAIYNELFVPRRMANYAGMRFDLDGREEWFCFVMRAEEAGVIDGKDAASFVRVARTAMNVASLATRLHTMRASDMLFGLNASGAAAIILDRQGRVMALTPGAERILGFGLDVTEGFLSSTNPVDGPALSALVHAARNRDAPLARRRFLLRGAGRRRPVLVTIAAVLDAALEALPGGRLLLVLSDLGAGDTGIEVELQDLFGLTDAEASIAAAIFSGGEPAEIARTRGVAEATVRKQISNAYRKLEVNRQAELVRLLAGLRR